MPSSDPDRKRHAEDQSDQTLAQKVETLQERVRKMGVVSDGSNDKAFMDEAWGENSGDREHRADAFFKRLP